MKLGRIVEKTHVWTDGMCSDLLTMSESIDMTVCYCPCPVRTGSRFEGLGIQSAMESFNTRFVNVVAVKIGPVVGEAHVWRKTILSIASSVVATEFALSIKAAVTVRGTRARLLVQLIQVHTSMVLRDEENVPKVR